MSISRLLAHCLALVAATTTATAVQTGSNPQVLAPAVVPQPLKVSVLPGYFTLNRQTVLAYAEADNELLPCVTALAGALRHSTGFPLPVRDVRLMPSTNVIVIARTGDDTLGTEGYRLSVEKDIIAIQAPTAHGAFYGANTLLQLFPPAIFSERPVRNRTWTAPCALIVDTPRYVWRGMHLDVSRHFFPKDSVKRYIDYLAMHKMNTFHWHLTDDQGWRIQIKRYPELTDIGAWRVDHEELHWNARPPQQPGERATYGGFYTQEEIREVVKYAAERFITVVPEIEMPAHATAIITAFPQYSCTGGPFTLPPGGIWPITDILCAGNDSTFEFVENVLKEVTDLFPGQYVHIGGDEAFKTEWKRCPKCQARIQNEQLADEDELQSYFIKRVEKILTRLNRRMIGWDEIIEGGLAPEASVMSWRGMKGGIAAARSGHDVVMTPTSHCYFDYYQADQRWEPLAIGALLPITKVYAYEPTPDSLTPAEARHILGTQANLWAEFLPDRATLEYMTFPRIAAIAEVAWSARDRRSWPDFLLRLKRQRERYRALSINVAPSMFSVAIRDSIDAAAHQGIVTLQTESGSEEIRYTLDGKRPTPKSSKYTAPITLSASATVTAGAFEGKRLLAPVTALRVWVPRHTIVGLTCESPLDSAYAQRGTAALFNNRRADPTRDDTFEWRGVSGKEMRIVVDLGTTVTVSQVTIGFLHQSGASVFLPSRVDVEVSDDGMTFTPAGHVSGVTLQKEPRPYVKDYTISVRKAKPRYLRVIAQNPGPLPPWHKGAGSPTLLLADEIIIE
jgi:hexosaminidase